MSLIIRTCCPACKSKEFKKLFSLPYKSEKISNFINHYYKNLIKGSYLDGYEYNLLQCLNCNLIFQEQIPDDQFSKDLYEKFIDPNESLSEYLKSANSSTLVLLLFSPNSCLKKFVFDTSKPYENLLRPLDFISN